MASDDTQGSINHGTLTNNGMSILYFDGHVEFSMNTEVHPERAVGDSNISALLHRLRN